ncbi:hypothetical protein L1O03_09225 [Corynebacterium uropygiale]|uniref:Apolipoprotein N-acyltransferase n=1 Tax=Corynebacterium uropygiale TaxID=1775911 RepID=A0A9X1QUQ4_9CORY|nr:hypothetical protein [Corynebacterium uropygiale]MCF4007350.1 hypothetical protein [Corynebacterium uropygiale]
MASPSESADRADRTPRQWWLPPAMALYVLVLPLLCHAFFARATAGWTILAAMLLGALAWGWLDARQFRFTWSFPSMMALVFWLSAALYYPEGAALYAFPVLGLALLGGKLGDR